MEKSYLFKVPQSPGTYSIVPVRGNSEEPVGEVSSAAVLWETVNTDVKPSVGTVISSAVYDSGTGLINYVAGSTPGNAVIAAKDASGKILWSWHIWNVLEEISVSLFGDSMVMDRNLGALSTEGNLSAGLMYVWGRKDPFLGAAALDGTTLIAATDNVNSKGAVASDSSTGTVEYSIANPATWISASVAPWDWIAGTRINDLWSVKKTIYDPCPAGYHVPSSGEWASVQNAPFILSGRLKVNSRGFSSNPGSQTGYWLCNASGNKGPCLDVEADGSCTITTNSLGLGSPVRCVVD